MSQTQTESTNIINYTALPDPKDADGPEAPMEVGFTEVPEPQGDKYEQREYIKGRLACAYRIFGKCGLNEGAAGHITARDPVDPHSFWVNPFGTNFNLIKKSDLIRVSHEGEVIDGGKNRLLNRAAFAIHSASMSPLSRPHRARGGSLLTILPTPQSMEHVKTSSAPHTPTPSTAAPSAPSAVNLTC